jgi:hypothetical protein
MESQKEVIGKIIRWTDQNWGTARYYVADESSPRKVFVHLSKVVSVEKPHVGARIEFTLGPARLAHELPQALRVKVLGVL